MNIMLPAVIFSFLLVMAAGGDLSTNSASAEGAIVSTSAAATAYWQRMLPNTPMPSAILELLTPPAGNDNHIGKQKTIHMQTGEEGAGQKHVRASFLKARKIGLYSTKEGLKKGVGNADDKKNNVFHYGLDTNNHDRDSKVFHYGLDMNNHNDKNTVFHYGSEPNTYDHNNKVFHYGLETNTHGQNTVFHYALDKHPHNQKNKVFHYSPDTNTHDQNNRVFHYGLDTNTHDTNSDNKNMVFHYGSDTNTHDQKNLVFHYGLDSNTQNQNNKVFHYGSDTNTYNQKNLVFHYDPETNSDAQDNKVFHYGLDSNTQNHNNKVFHYGSDTNTHDQKNLVFHYGPETNSDAQNNKVFHYGLDSNTHDQTNKVFHYGQETNTHDLKTKVFHYGPDMNTNNRKNKDLAEAGNNGESVEMQSDFIMPFFLEEVLTPGSTVTPFIPPSSISGALLLQRDLAASIPMSTRNFTDILTMYAPVSDAMAKDIWSALDFCENSLPVKGEKRACATSLESMVEFAASVLTAGSTGDLRAFSSPDVRAEGVMSGRYKVSAARRTTETNQSMTCHSMRFPFPVFMCHAVNPTRVYTVALEKEYGAGSATGGGGGPDRVEALAVCHIDTSDFNPRKMPAHVKPGDAPICHFIARNSILWTPPATEPVVAAA